MPKIVRQNSPLFSGPPLADLLHMRGLEIEQRVVDLHADQILVTPVEDLVDMVQEDFLLQPLTLHRDQGQSSEPVEANFYSSEQQEYLFRGFKYELLIPFSGAKELFSHAPEARDANPPHGYVREDVISFTIVVQDADVTVTTEEMQKQLDAVDRYIAFQALQLVPFNAGIRDKARTLIETRKAGILAAKHVATSLGFPMRRREGAPATYSSPKVRRTIQPIRKIPAEGFVPEPAIDEVEYQNILRIIENMSFVMERNPSVFSNAPEETIRDHYLVQLNGQYEGGATGETFNASGKTDILVKDGSRNIFIAECKIWRGPQSVTEAINQLLGYLTWRDTKAALILFNRNKDLSNVLTKAREEIDLHPNKKRPPQIESETRFRYIFGKPDDANREINLTVMIFDMPTPKDFGLADAHNA